MFFDKFKRNGRLIRRGFVQIDKDRCVHKKDRVSAMEEENGEREFCEKQEKMKENREKKGGNRGDIAGEKILRRD